MVRVKHCPEPKIYDDYYIQNGGGDYPIFRGTLIQKGHGLGGLMGGLSRIIIPLIKPILKRGLKHAIPMIKSGAKELGKRAIKSGIKSIGDVIIKRKNPRQAFKDNLLRNLAVNTTPRSSSQSSRPRKRKRNNTNKRVKKRVRIHSDIFS